jgi:hypothetical protein
MRLTPAQIAVQLLCGVVLPKFHPSPITNSGRVREGHDMLVEITGKDFGYDLHAWHDHLKESREGGYTYGRNIVLPKIMQAAIASPTWQEAVQMIEAADRNSK